MAKIKANGYFVCIFSLLFLQVTPDFQDTGIDWNLWTLLLPLTSWTISFAEPSVGDISPFRKHIFLLCGRCLSNGERPLRSQLKIIHAESYFTILFSTVRDMKWQVLMIINLLVQSLGIYNNNLHFLMMNDKNKVHCFELFVAKYK